MNKHLFITGPDGCGKSALIREVLGERLAYAGGFITEPVCGEAGVLLGHDLFPAAAAADRSLYTGQRFLDCIGPAPVRNNEVFRVNAVQLMQEAACYPYAMIDAFGGFEVIIPQFRQALADFLNLDLPIIGVLKDSASVARLQKYFGLGDRFPETAAMIRRVIASGSSCTLLEMKTPGEASIRRAVESWAREYLLF